MHTRMIFVSPDADHTVLYNEEDLDTSRYLIMNKKLAFSTDMSISINSISNVVRIWRLK